MRWKKLQHGDTRKIKKFALFPITDGEEVRWLETVTVEQRCYDPDYIIFPWRTIRFIDRKERGG